MYQGNPLFYDMTNTKSCLKNGKYDIYPKYDFGVNMYSPFTQKTIFTKNCSVLCIETTKILLHPVHCDTTNLNKGFQRIMNENN